jgi:hypothetical protein
MRRAGDAGGEPRSERGDVLAGQASRRGGGGEDGEGGEGGRHHRRAERQAFHARQYTTGHRPIATD